MAFQFPANPTLGQQFAPTSGATYEWNGTGWIFLGVSTASLYPAGIVLPYAGSESLPFQGWLLCDGKGYSTTAQAVLFAVIGYTYGGSGASFNVPDLRGRVVAAPDGMGGTRANRIGSSVSALTPGGAGGAEGVNLTVAELPPHAHGITDVAHGHGVSDPGHAHAMSDPGHTHSITDVAHGHGNDAHSHSLNAHTHGVNDPTHNHGVSDGGHAHGVNDGGHGHGYDRADSINVEYALQSGGSHAFDHYQSNPGAVTNGAGTNISIQGSGSNIGINGNATGISIAAAASSVNATTINIHGSGSGINGTNAAVTGAFAAAAGTNIAIAVNGTGLSTTNSAGSGGGHLNLQPTLLLNYIIKT